MCGAGCRREAECEILPVVLSESSCFAYRKFVGAKKTNYFCTALSYARATRASDVVVRRLSCFVETVDNEQ